MYQLKLIKGSFLEIIHPPKKLNGLVQILFEVNYLTRIEAIVSFNTKMSFIPTREKDVIWISLIWYNLSKWIHAG